MSLKPRMGAIVFFDMPGSTEMMIRDPRTAVPTMFRHNAMCRVIIESMRAGSSRNSATASW